MKKHFSCYFEYSVCIVFIFFQNFAFIGEIYSGGNLSTCILERVPALILQQRNETTLWQYLPSASNSSAIGSSQVASASSSVLMRFKYRNSEPPVTLMNTYTYILACKIKFDFYSLQSFIYANKTEFMISFFNGNIKHTNACSFSQTVLNRLFFPFEEHSST